MDEKPVAMPSSVLRCEACGERIEDQDPVYCYDDIRLVEKSAEYWAGEACRFRAGVEEILLCRAVAHALGKPHNTGSDVASFYEEALRGLLAGKRVERSGDGLRIYEPEGT